MNSELLVKLKLVARLPAIRLCIEEKCKNLFHYVLSMGDVVEVMASLCIL